MPKSLSQLSLENVDSEQQKKEFSEAINLVYDTAQTADDLGTIQSARFAAGAWWREVCWAAAPRIRSGVPLEEALVYGLKEWDR